MQNEKRFIDANAADVNEIPCYYDDYCTTEDVQHWLNAQPTVDAVEVVHGRWRVSRESEISKTVWCTACGEEFYLHKKNTVHIDKMPYCPNCGAKMDGDV